MTERSLKVVRSLFFMSSGGSLALKLTKGAQASVAPAGAWFRFNRYLQNLISELMRCSLAMKYPIDRAAINKTK